jgi:type VI secretion system FHA domain protein
MQLTMTVLRCPDMVAPETRNVAGGEFSVGRGPGVDWVLPDPERLLSKRHFAVAYRSGIWQLADTSTNGTFLNRDIAAIGAGDVRNLRDGDRVRLGAYEIEIRLVDDAIARPGAASGNGRFDDPFGVDPFAPPRPQRNAFDEADHRDPRIGPTMAQLPHAFDPLAPDPAETPFRGPTQPDHSPVMEDAFRPPPSVGQAPLHGGVIPADDLLPDDWDKDLLEGLAPSASPPRPIRKTAAPPRPPQPAPLPSAPPPAPPQPAANDAALLAALAPACLMRSRMTRPPICWRWARRSANSSPGCARC